MARLPWQTPPMQSFEQLQLKLTHLHWLGAHCEMLQWKPTGQPVFVQPSGLGVGQPAASQKLPWQQLGSFFGHQSQHRLPA
jgi:hypothetical protein